MITRQGDLVAISGRMTIAEAESLLGEGRALIAAPATVVDLAQVTEADSSALAVLFGWLRDAEARGIRLEFRNAPQNLLSLADVYGVADFLPRH